MSADGERTRRASARAAYRQAGHYRVCRVVPGAEGAVGDESDRVRLALGEHVAPAAAGEVELVLHGADVSDRSGAGELLEGGTKDADVPELALALQVLERADRLCAGNGWVGGVQLVEIDAIESKPAQRRLAGGRGGSWASTRSALPWQTGRWARCVRSRLWQR
jgi:hypothetical protein